MNNVISRRKILQKGLNTALVGGAGAVLGPMLLSSCERKAQQEAADALRENLETHCPGQENLSAQEIGLRKNLKYVDQSPYPTRTCDNCRLYTNPPAGSFCGGCKMFTSPVHPKGYCTSWYARM